MRRDDFRPVNCFRSDRFFSVSGRWYFVTREGEDLGPFSSREEAANALTRYLETQFAIHYLRGVDPTLSGKSGSSARLVARMSAGLHDREDLIGIGSTAVPASAGV